MSLVKDTVVPKSLENMESRHKRLLIPMDEMHARDNYGGYLCTSLPLLDEYMFSKLVLIHLPLSTLVPVKSVHVKSK